MSENIDIVTPQSDDDAFREAFDSAVRDMEDDAKAGALSPIRVTRDEDPSEPEQNNVAEEAEEYNGEEYIEEEQQESPAPSEIDYKALYLKHQQMADAQIGLLHSRLGNLKNQYQELKKSVKQQTLEEEEVPAKVPDKVREVFESYPDLGDAIQEYIKHELGKTRKNVKGEIESHIRPIQEHLVMTEAKRHEMTIRSAHPDLDNLLRSGDVVAWIESLPPMMKIGAGKIYQNGSAEEVVSLLNEYKQARGITNAIPSRKVPSREHGAPAQRASAPQRKESRASSVRADSRVTMDDETKQRLISALGVPSNRGSVELRDKPSFYDEFDMYVRQFEQSKRR